MMWLLVLNLEVNWEMVPPPPPSPSGFICSIWCSTWYPGKKKNYCGRRKMLVFCPTWNLIQKFRILEDKKQTEGEGRKAEKDGEVFFFCQKNKLTKYSATSDKSKSIYMPHASSRIPRLEGISWSCIHSHLCPKSDFNCCNCCWMAT